MKVASRRVCLPSVRQHVGLQQLHILMTILSAMLFLQKSTRAHFAPASRRVRCCGSAFLPARPTATATAASAKHVFSSSLLSSSLSTTNSDVSEKDPLMDPRTLKMDPPQSLSPSAAKEFMRCPQSYLFQYIYKMKQPTNKILAKGIMCHEALEKLFDLQPKDRTLEHLQNLFRASWAVQRTTDTYSPLFQEPDEDWDIESERKWGKEGLQLLQNYYELEDPKEVESPNPLKREIWLVKKLTTDPSLGITAASDDTNNLPLVSSEPNTFLVRGIIDRLDMIRLSEDQVGLRIVDYKTGKLPNFKYSEAFNKKIAEEAFFQLKIYALLLREQGAGKNQPSNALPLQKLRLLHLTSHDGPARNLDFDLGETQEQRDLILQETHQELANIWANINELVATQDPTKFHHCDQKWCYCHKRRGTFLPGTVAE